MAVDERPALDPLAPTKSEQEAHEQIIAPNDLLIISVGHDLNPTKFHLPKTLACSRSPVLASACETYASQFPDSPITLCFKDLLPYCFAIYHTWLLTSSLDVEPNSYKGPVRRHSKESLSHPICAYVIGEQLKDTALRNAAITKCCEIHQREKIIPSIYHIEYAWENTREEAPLRVWMMDVWSVDVDEEMFVELMDSLPGTFLVEVMRRVFRLRERAKKSIRLVDDANSYREEQ